MTKGRDTPKDTPALARSLYRASSISRSAFCVSSFARSRSSFVTWDPQTKAPKVATTNGIRAASSTNPRTWRTFEEALEAYRTGRFGGIGRILTEGYVGIDFDEVRDPERGVIIPEVWEIIRYFDSYTEVSPAVTINSRGRPAPLGRTSRTPPGASGRSGHRFWWRSRHRPPRPRRVSFPPSPSGVYRSGPLRRAPSP
jgi:hypothetical protein